jgi:hypothetical protein
LSPTARFQPPAPSAPPDPTRTRLGCGCGLLVALAMAGAVAFTWRSYRGAQDFQAALANPERRAANTRAVLPYRELPAGYHPLGALTIPTLQLAILSDAEPTAASAPVRRFRDRGFLFARVLDPTGGKYNDIRAYLANGQGRPGWLANVNVELQPHEVLGRGQLASGGRTVRYAALRAGVSVDGPSRDGLVALLLADCPDRFHTHFGLWFALDSATGPRTSTPADPAALAGFLAHFDLCAPR